LALDAGGDHGHTHVGEGEEEQGREEREITTEDEEGTRRRGRRRTASEMGEDATTFRGTG
jgi:hypothetical protein